MLAPQATAVRQSPEPAASSRRLTILTFFSTAAEPTPA